MLDFGNYNNLIKWLELREEGGYEFPSSLDQLKLSMIKSALLERLSEGKEALPVPPPKSYSYPWYSLIEKGEGTSSDVWQADTWVNELYNGSTLFISQCPWKILSKINDEEWLAAYSYSFYDEVKYSEDTWHIYKVDNYWIIKKLPP